MSAIVLVRLRRCLPETMTNLSHQPSDAVADESIVPTDVVNSAVRPVPNVTEVTLQVTFGAADAEISGHVPALRQQDRHRSGSTCSVSAASIRISASARVRCGYSCGPATWQVTISPSTRIINCSANTSGRATPPS
jgi:hypothetical protein